jgi:hypothetical protein
MNAKLDNAIDDYRYLLSRGYGRERAIEIVGERYLLGQKNRLILYRAVYDDETANSHRQKMVSLEEVLEERLSVDGYNVLITVESMLRKKPLILCDDGFIRDISGIYGKHRLSSYSEHALTLIMELLTGVRPSEVRFYYDQQVSRSGELASLTRKLLNRFAVDGNAETARQADNAALRFKAVLATSDTVLIERGERLFDLAAEVVRRSSPTQILAVHQL